MFLNILKKNIIKYITYLFYFIIILSVLLSPLTNCLKIDLRGKSGSKNDISFKECITVTFTLAIKK